jgi:hypothetical protein
VPQVFINGKLLDDITRQLAAAIDATAFFFESQERLSPAPTPLATFSISCARPVCRSLDR